MKVVGVIPAGREKYMRCLVPYLIRERHVFDHIQLFDNAHVCDRPFLARLVERHPTLFRFVDVPEDLDKNDPNHRVANLTHIHRNTVDPDTLYVRIDDDIVWIADGAIERLVKFRLENPSYWMVVGNIINNSATYILHQGGELLSTWSSEFIDKTHRYPAYANAAHEIFFERYGNKELSEYDMGVWDGGFTSANMVRLIPNQVYAFFGRDWATFGGKVDGPSEYEYVGQVQATRARRRNCIYGPSLFVHYSYKPQESNINPKFLEEYWKLAKDMPQ